MFIYTFGVNECSREGVCVVTTTRITIIKTGLFSQRNDEGEECLIGVVVSVSYCWCRRR